MKAYGVRLYGANNLKLEEFELPKIKDDEILVKVVSDSVCMSTYKAVILGTEHKRVPKNVATNPVLIGHEFAGDIVEVGSKWASQFKAGQKFAQQPALNYKGSLASPGYSYEWFGGNVTYTVIPMEVMELGCLLPYNGNAYFDASLGEPMSCIVGAYHASYHTTPGSYNHVMGTVIGGKMAILAGTGPMGLGAIDYAISCDRKPSLLVVSDIDDARLARAKSIFDKKAKDNGVALHFINVKGDNATAIKNLLDFTDGKGFDDVFVYAPVKEAIEMGDDILGRDGCLNFFAGPTDTKFKANFNFYNAHYTSTHIVGTSGGNVDDLKESLEMSAKGLINPAVMLTHIGGIDSTIDTVLNLPKIPGGKKMIYNHINMPLTSIDDIMNKPQTDSRFKHLASLLATNNGIWNVACEEYLLANFA